MSSLFGRESDESPPPLTRSQGCWLGALALLGVALTVGLWILDARRLLNRYSHPSQLRQAILQLAPVGTSIAEASTRLEAEGLECAPPSYAPFELQGFLTYAHCTGQGSTVTGLGTTDVRRVRRAYRIALIDKAGTLADVIVASSTF